MKTMIFSLFVLTFALGFTSCGDSEDDPTPSNPTSPNSTLSINNFIGDWLSNDVVQHNGSTLNSPCDVNWTVSNFRKLKLDINTGLQTSNIYSNNGTTTNCAELKLTFQNLTATFDKTTNILEIDPYQFEISEVTSTSFKGKLIFTGGNISMPLNGIFIFIKQ